MTEDQGNGNGAHGGVGHLLRMAKTQCGVSLAFAALRKADGGFAIATFPSLTTDPSWSVEAIDELVRQTWEDPHLSGGTVLVRSGRVLKGMWTGQGHHIKLAAAALSDPEAPDHPWGLLCVAEPVAGQFEQDQLNLLGSLAVRLTSYLRARQQVLEESPAFQPAGEPVQQVPQVPTEPAYEPMVETPIVAQPSAPVSGPAVAPPVVGFMEPSVPTHFGELLDDDGELLGDLDAEHPLDRALDTVAPADEGWGAQTAASEPRPDDWEFLGLDEIEWVEAAAPAPPPPAAPAPPPPAAPAPPPPAAPAPPPPAAPGPFASALPFDATVAPGSRPEPPSTFGTRAHEPVEAAPPSGIGSLDALLGPDPVTGLATLTTLVGRLSSSLTHVANNEGMVALILVNVAAADGSQELSATALMTVAGRLTNHLRDRDMVARIGPALFAVLVDLRPGAIDVESIRQRTVGTLTAGIESTTGGLQARSSVATANAGSTVSAEDLLRQAADQLRGQ
jgi:GGDEF domain-containing protein